MSLVIFPIIIGLCVLGLIFLFLKKIPQIANYSMEPLVPVRDLVSAVPSKAELKKTAILAVFFGDIKKYYLKIKQGFSRVMKKILEMAKKIKPVILVKKKIIGLRQRLVIRKKGDFNQLKEFFDKKKTPFILPPAATEGNDVSELAITEKLNEVDKSIASPQSLVETEFLTKKASQEHLDFKKFLNNGGQGKRPYRLEKVSFDQLFKKNKSKTSQPKITKTEKKPVETFADKENTEITKFVQKEQALVQQIADEPRNGELYAKLGELYLKVRNWQDAKASFNYLLELEPQNKKARSALDKINKVLHN
ncbi:MAG: hypothetical protein COS76_03675 [Candidatus Portnoybacteria bacterium CG06_land_8_20_14_3_00_39_12]|uniref:Uncharacterized protein n=2 Tax=Candidatus Portnoyibacteriota TaxID=1817913 RepID=A0A2M8KFD9_9BACT|nr:MAG: hypothetical protein COS76_03675 [Candidatus Portnoybacteria bacterium CG06_land_8_20_14_3_00_39_12]PJE58603.1 MAG: hypothetical protein COU83_03000 [Candidatus Portnoybacteria bacterium CG10_big_fil_rev_8_21_14_0_10_40_22]